MAIFGCRWRRFRFGYFSGLRGYNQLQYLDADGDSFGSTTMVACGVFNNIDCNDNQLQYLDADGDGFGSVTLVACGVTNNSDCNDNQLQYLDADGDSFGSTTMVACGVFNNIDCNDNQLQYLDADGDGFGSPSVVACGVTNNSDCNDNQLQYLDADGDGFGSTTLAGCGVFNNADCDDTSYNGGNMCTSTVNLKLMIQGYYNAGTMRSVKFNQDGVSPTTDVENITVELHSATAPFALAYSTTALLKTDGSVICQYTSVSGNYYIVVKSSNTIQTWSAVPVLVGTNPIAYDFTTDAAKAFGNNMAQLAPGVFGFYSGDMNQDGNIDTIDFPIWEVNSNNFIFTVKPGN